MRDFFITLRGVECIVEYEADSDDFGPLAVNWSVAPLNDDGSKGPWFDLTDEEDVIVGTAATEHMGGDDCYDER